LSGFEHAVTVVSAHARDARMNPGCGVILFSLPRYV